MKSFWKNPRDVFFGWWTVLASGIMMTWGFGVDTYSYGLYYEPLEKEFGWTRAQISASASLKTIEGGLEGPFGGYFTDKYGPRIVNLLGFIIAGTGLCLMYFVHSLWMYYLAWGILVSIGFNLGMWGPLSAAMANWFVKKRGLATSLARVIIGIGDTFIPILILILITQFGWRIAGLISGLVTWILGIPLTWFFVKPNRPEFYGLMPDGVQVNAAIAEDQDALIRAGQEYSAKTTGEVEFTLRQAVKTRAFWIGVFAEWPRRIASPLLSRQLIPYLVSVGIDALNATTALGLMVFMSVPGRLIGGLLSDRVSLNRLKYIIFLARAIEWIGIIFLAYPVNIWMVYAYSVIRGVGHGINIGQRAQQITRFFGRKGYATITGIQALLAIPVGAVAPIYVAWLWDTTGSYSTALSQALILSLIGVVMWLFYNPPKRVDVISDVKNFL
ncbi:MAG: MFS transporter [Promethearchaeota archaeon]